MSHPDQDQSSPPAQAQTDALRDLLRRAPESQEGPPARRALLLCASVAILAAVVGLGTYAVAQGQSPPARQVPAAPELPVSAAPSPAAGAPGCCASPSEPENSEALLVAAPAGVEWELFQGVALPHSSVDGPSRVDGAVHAGYSRTPTGALLAAAQIGVRRVATPDLAGLRQVADEQLLDGSGRQAHLQLLETLTDNEPPAGGYSQYVAFRMLTWTPELAIVSLATRATDGQLLVAVDTLRWVHRDWRLELPADGLQRPQIVTDLSGYVPWSGVS